MTRYNCFDSRAIMLIQTTLATTPCRKYSRVRRAFDSIQKLAYASSIRAVIAAEEKSFSVVRRSLTHSLLIGVIVAAANPLAAQISTALRVGLVSRSNSGVMSASSIERGVRLGTAEATQTAALFGGDVELLEMVARGKAESAAQRLLDSGKVQVLIGSAAEDIEALSKFAELHRVIFINVVSRRSSIRAACRRYTFHVEASDSMYANAARRATLNASGTRFSVVLWAPNLEKYGASQINGRYEARYHLPMDGNAWAAWAAVKIAADAVLRVKSARADAIRSYLENPSTTFDGHKGWPLSFRREDHQLRQPLYVGSSSGAAPPTRASLRDIPALGAIAGGSRTDANRALDALMPAPRCE